MVASFISFKIPSKILSPSLDSTRLPTLITLPSDANTIDPLSPRYKAFAWVIVVYCPKGVSNFKSWSNAISGWYTTKSKYSSLSLNEFIKFTISVFWLTSTVTKLSFKIILLITSNSSFVFLSGLKDLNLANASSLIEIEPSLTSAASSFAIMFWSAVLLPSFNKNSSFASINLFCSTSFSLSFLKITLSVSCERIILKMLIKLLSVFNFAKSILTPTSCNALVKRSSTKLTVNSVSVILKPVNKPKMLSIDIASPAWLTSGAGSSKPCIVLFIKDFQGTSSIFNNKSKYGILTYNAPSSPSEPM